MTTEAQTSTEYIRHHLQNLTAVCMRDTFTARTVLKKQRNGILGVERGYLVVSWCWVWYFVHFSGELRRKPTKGVPSGVQNFVEWVIEFMTTGPRLLPRPQCIGRAAGADHISVDLHDEPDGRDSGGYVPYLAEKMGLGHFKVVPSTDPNATLACRSAYFSWSILQHQDEGVGGFIGELTFMPFGQIVRC